MNFKAHVLVFSAVAFFLSNSLLGQRELYANQSQSTSEASQVDSKSTQTQADPEQTPKTSGKSPNEQQPTQTGVGKEAEKKKSDEPGRSTNGKSEKAGKEKTPSRSTTKPVPKKQIRAIELSGNYVDLLEPMQLDAGSLLFGGELQKPKSFFRLCDYLDELGKDELVTHIAFDLSDHLLTMNSAQLDELTRRLAQLKGTGKKTLAWLENASNVQLAIAAACDQIVMADFGGIDMPSTVMESMFYRDAMDLVGIKASVVRAGDFKGAVEPFVNPVMSEHLREHYRELLKSMNDAQVSRIAKGRGLTAAVVRECQRERMLLPKDALAKGLVDQLAPYGSMKETITKIAGAELEWTTPKAKPKREMSFFELMGNIMSGPRRSATRVREDSIAVLHLSGAIVDGKRAIPGSIVSGPSVKTIDELAKDEKIKGVVVRINSPGGSATASEAIRKSLESLANSKPVVFSMGEVAASGGYWVTCIGQPVYAEQGTITGSIGVFAMKISLGSLLRRIGVHIESVTLDDSAAFDSIGREWNDTDSQNLQRLIDDVYDRFLDLASSSRKMPLDKLKGLAAGRVWSGRQAKENGLVDEVGGLDASLAAVAKRAKLDNYKVVHRPEPSSGISLFELLGEGDESELSVLGKMFNDFIATTRANNGATLGTNPASAELMHSGLEMLRSRGFRLQTTNLFVQESINPQRGRATVWALVPLELSFR